MTPLSVSPIPSYRKRLLQLSMSSLLLLAHACLADGSTDAAIASSTDSSQTTSNISTDSGLWNLHAQTTWIGQVKPGFSAPYTGDNSLKPTAEDSYSLSGTIYAGARLWDGGALFVNPEVMQARPLSGLHGLAGLTDSEQQKGSSSTPKLYLARVYLQQTVDLGGGSEQLDDGPNQLATMVDKHRLVMTLGYLSVIDLFDGNSLAHDARTQFMNWSFLAHGSFDYAGDTRGYTKGLITELDWDDWSARVGHFEVPRDADGQALDNQVFNHYGEALELEHQHTLWEQEGTLRLLAWRNREVMGRFDDAIAYAQQYGGTPDTANVRRLQTKVGYGINLEQSLTPDIGVFARLNWADGNTETYGFDEIERQLSLGTLVQGQRWGRKDDHLGIAWAQNELDKAHQDYLALGGLGPFIGDGAISYKPEQVVEVFYDGHVMPHLNLGAGWQHIWNPAYNADRGTLNVFSLRAHVEF